MDVERIVFRLVADATQYQRTMTMVENQIVRTTQKMTGLGPAFTFPLNVAVGGMAGLGAAAVAAGGYAIKLATDYEQASIALEVMTGSAAKAQSVLKDINKLAVETPFRSTELVESAKQLKAFGFDTEQLIPIMRRLGDISSGTGTSMERLILAFGQVKTAGRLFGPELRQFTDAGVPMIRYLAEVTGKREDEIRGMVQKGQVTYDVVVKAINKMTNPAAEGGMFGGMMERQSQTVAGRWSNLVENIELGLRNTGLKFLEGFGLADLLNDTAKWSRGFQNVSDSVVVVSKRLREMLDVASQIGSALAKDIFGSMSVDLDTFTDPKKWAEFKQNAIDSFTTVADGARMAASVIKSLKNEFVAISTPLSTGAIGGFSTGGVYGSSRAKGNDRVTSALAGTGASLMFGFTSVWDGIFGTDTTNELALRAARQGNLLNSGNGTYGGGKFAALYKKAEKAKADAADPANGSYLSRLLSSQEVISPDKDPTFAGYLKSRNAASLAALRGDPSHPAYDPSAAFQGKKILEYDDMKWWDREYKLANRSFDTYQNNKGDYFSKLNSLSGVGEAIIKSMFGHPERSPEIDPGMSPLSKTMDSLRKSFDSGEAKSTYNALIKAIDRGTSSMDEWANDQRDLSAAFKKLKGDVGGVSAVGLMAANPFAAAAMAVNPNIINPAAENEAIYTKFMKRTQGLGGTLELPPAAMKDSSEAQSAINRSRAEIKSAADEVVEKMEQMRVQSEQMTKWQEDTVKALREGGFLKILGEGQ